MLPLLTLFCLPAKKPLPQNGAEGGALQGVPVAGYVSAHTKYRCIAAVECLYLAEEPGS